jgi:hypothetical protein
LSTFALTENVLASIGCEKTSNSFLDILILGLFSLYSSKNLFTSFFVIHHKVWIKDLEALTPKDLVIQSGFINCHDSKNQTSR